MRRSVLTAVMTSIALLVAIQPVGAYERPGQTHLFDACMQRCVTNSAFDQVGPLVSFDRSGRFVAFPNDQPVSGVRPSLPGLPDVFVWDRTEGKTALASTSSSGIPAIYPGGGGSYNPHLSANGRYVVFSSNAVNLVDGDTNLTRDVFVHDRKNRTTERVSVGAGGQQANGTSDAPAISADGRYVAFWSVASNLVEGDANGVIDVFVHDLRTGKTERVSVASDGSEGRATGQEGGGATRPSISATGRYVAFHSWSDNLAEGDTNGSTDVFVHDRKTDKTHAASVNDHGELGDFGGSTSWTGPQGLSADGRYVIFTSTSHNLVPNDANLSILVVNTAIDVFVHDLKTQRTQRVSVASSGEEAEGVSGADAAAIAASGRHVTFSSSAANLASPDTGGTGLPWAPSDLDVFVHDRATGATEMVSLDHQGAEATECREGFDCATPLGISGDGRTIAFDSYSSLHPRDGSTSSESTMYLRERGVPLGVSGWDDPSKTGAPEDGICLVQDICVGTRSAVSIADETDDVSSAADARGANLIGARLVHRRATNDLFGVLELRNLPPTPQLATSAAGLVYGLSFEIDGSRYELRAAATGLGPNGQTTADLLLFSCSDIACRQIARASGGLGTSGQRVTFSFPLDPLEAAPHAALSGVKAWTAVGTLIGGPLRVLDEAVPANASN